MMNFESSSDSTNSLILISIFNIINDFLENIQIEIEENGFHIFGFDIEQINNIFKNINRASIDSILLGYNEDKMIIRVIKSNGSISNYNIPEVYTDIKEKYEINDNIDYQCEVLMPSTLLSEICNELKSFKDLNLKIQVDRNNLFFKIDDSIINADIVLENKKTKEFFLICKKKISVEFKNKYFLKINNIAKKINIKECFLQIGENLPLIIVFSISSVSTFQFYLAPILE
ncbi:hypothetical protein RB653_003123 [Dictyostelium firmibasis]|uniref:Proliferating cell nuclear antigen PCNA C-terminal domain-containing protein n=1 Tax=Dictyostelium firmibasis TaxID=79012 RepID=A0AAN7TZE9_9MYCE